MHIPQNLPFLSGNWYIYTNRVISILQVVKPSQFYFKLFPIILKKKPRAHVQSLHVPSHRQLLIYLLSLQFLLFRTLPINITLDYVAFCAFLLSLSYMFLGFWDVVAWISTSFLFMAE